MKKELDLYDTFSRKKKGFKPLKNNLARIYACGPTVYTDAHIGNFSTYIVVDLLLRYLRFLSYKTKLVRNITDVGHLTSDADIGEDKIDKAARIAKLDPLEIAKKYTKKFHKDCESLNLLKPDIEPRASNHIKEQIAAVKKLIDQGYAYETPSGVYFDITKDRQYGKLAKLKIDKVKTKRRVEKVPDKKHPFDFALWFKAIGKHKDHLQNWDSPWGKGFPGWHLECSVMSEKYLGNPFDIHTGGIDHIPIHHVNEIAQSKALYGKNPSNFWFHHEFLEISGEKMAKSKGGFLTLDDLKKQGFSPQVFKFCVLSVHYRSKLSFSSGSLKQAQTNLDTIAEFIQRLQKLPSKTDPKLEKLTKETHKQIIQALNDDLNTPKALSLLFKLIRIVNHNLDRGKPIPKQKILAISKDLEDIFGIKFAVPKALPKKVLELIRKREKIRKNQKYTLADKIRKDIEKLGIEIKDTAHGTEWRYK